MELKVHLHSVQGKITGTLDAPKIKKRACRTHFGLLAVLNHPKLSADWFQHFKDLVTIKQVQIRNREDELLAEQEQVQLSPQHILWAYEDDPKERRRMKREQEKKGTSAPAREETARLRFASDCGMIFEGDYISEVNEIGVMRGKGFITLANATVISQGDPASFQRLPFVAINSHAVTNVTANRPAVVEHAEEAASSAA